MGVEMACVTGEESPVPASSPFCAGSAAPAWHWRRRQQLDDAAHHAVVGARRLPIGAPSGTPFPANAPILAGPTARAGRRRSRWRPERHRPAASAPGPPRSVPARLWARSRVVLTGDDPALHPAPPPPSATAIDAGPSRRSHTSERPPPVMGEQRPRSGDAPGAAPGDPDHVW